MKSHPSYPNLVSLTDTLEELGLQFEAIRMDKSEIDKIILPCLLQIKEDKTKFIVVIAKKWLTKQKQYLSENWTGITVMVKPGQNIENSSNNEQNKNEIIQSTITKLALFFTFVSLILILLQAWSIVSSIFIFSGFVGLFITQVIFLQRSGHSNKWVKKLCNNDVSCSDIIQNNRQWIFGKLETYDFGIIYFFTITSFAILITLSGQLQYLNYLFFPVTLGVMIGFYSIYYQFLIIKKWCKLCIATFSIVACQFLLLIGFFLTHGDIIIKIELKGISIFFFSFSISLVWLIIKPILQTRLDKIKSDIKYAKVKRDPSLFKLMLLEETFTDTTIPNNPFYFGKKKTPVHVTIVSGLKCGPCANAHKILVQLVKRYPNEFSFSLIFLINNTDSQKDSKVTVLKKIISALPYYNTFEILEYWYDSKNLEAFDLKFTVKHYDGNQDDLIRVFHNFCINEKISETPSIFINGYKIPNFYDIRDVETFIHPISEGLLDETKEIVENK